MAVNTWRAAAAAGAAAGVHQGECGQARVFRWRLPLRLHVLHPQRMEETLPVFCAWARGTAGVLCCGCTAWVVCQDAGFGAVGPFCLSATHDGTVFVVRVGLANAGAARLW